MSHVTNVLISVGYEDAETIALFKKWFDEKAGGIRSLSRGSAESLWGGTKYPECNLWAGAFNYLDTEGMVAHLKSVPFGGEVRVFMQGQEENVFTEFLVLRPSEHD
jgi:hypothetical protein